MADDKNAEIMKLIQQFVSINKSVPSERLVGNFRALYGNISRQIKTTVSFAPSGASKDPQTMLDTTEMLKDHPGLLILPTALSVCVMNFMQLFPNSLEYCVFKGLAAYIYAQLVSSLEPKDVEDHIPIYAFLLVQYPNNLSYNNNQLATTVSVGLTDKKALKF